MNRVEFGDCRETMRRWATDGVKVQTCVTSPPYFGLRDYGHAGQIGSMPVGPRCARRAGLMPLAGKRSGLVRPGPAYRSHATRQEIAQMDLFEVVAA